MCRTHPTVTIKQLTSGRTKKKTGRGWMVWITSQLSDRVTDTICWRLNGEYGSMSTASRTQTGATSGMWDSYHQDSSADPNIQASTWDSLKHSMRVQTPVPEYVSWDLSGPHNYKADIFLIKFCKHSFEEPECPSNGDDFVSNHCPLGI